MSIPAACRSSMGWKGYARVGGTGGPVLPYTSEDLAERINLYSSQSIHGGGVGAIDGVFGSVVNIAIGHAEYQGSIKGEVFAGGGGFTNAFIQLISRAIGASSGDHTLRICGFLPSTGLILSPGGGSTFQFPNDNGAGQTNRKACVSRFTINGNPKAIIDYDCEIISAGFKPLATGTGVATTSEFSYEPVSNTDDDNPVPYYNAVWDVQGSGEGDVKNKTTKFTLTVNNNTYTLYTFNGSNQPTDVLQGIMEVSGSFQIYSPDGAFAFPLTNGATLALGLGPSINLGSNYMAFSRAPVTSSGGLNQPVFRDIEFMCVAANPASASLFIV